MTISCVLPGRYDRRVLLRPGGPAGHGGPAQQGSLSFEATVKLPEALDGRGGVIIGSWMDAGYYDYDLGYVSLEVYENGAPRLYWHQERRNQPTAACRAWCSPG